MPGAHPLSQALNPPLLSGVYVGYAEVGIETLFCVELLAHAVLEPRKLVSDLACSVRPIVRDIGLFCTLYTCKTA